MSGCCFLAGGRRVTSFFASDDLNNNKISSHGDDYCRDAGNHNQDEQHRKNKVLEVVVHLSFINSTP